VRERRLAEVRVPADGLVGVDRAPAARRDGGEAVVLGSDLDAPGLQVHDRMVGSTVAEGQLEGLEPDRAAEELVAEADAPDGLRPHELSDGLDDVGERGRVAGAVGEEDRVGILGGTVPEWTLSDFGALCSGATVVPSSSQLVPQRPLSRL